MALEIDTAVSLASPPRPFPHSLCPKPRSHTGVESHPLPYSTGLLPPKLCSHQTGGVRMRGIYTVCKTKCIKQEKTDLQSQIPVSEYWSSDHFNPVLLLRLTIHRHEPKDYPLSMYLLFVQLELPWKVSWHLLDLRIKEVSFPSPWQCPSARNATCRTDGRE